MRIREPRAGWAVFLWLWAVLFGGVPLFILVSGAGGGGDAPVPLLLLFPTVAVVAMVPIVRRSLRSGFRLEPDGIHGAHDAEAGVVPWEEVARIEWRWAEQTSDVKVNGKPLPDGYALHAVLGDGRAVRLMQRVAARYGQQQAVNDQVVRAQAAGALPVAFDATIPTHGAGEWSGTPPSQTHTTWEAGDLPPASSSPLGGGGDGPVWPSG